MLEERAKWLADSGYQGIRNIHANSEHPKKKSRKRPLSKEERARNRVISSMRIVIENIIREVKIFRIIAEKYRNRRKRFAMRFNLIAAIYNISLSYV
jgi:IS5 family transposase